VPTDSARPQVQQADSSDIGDTSGVPELIAAPSIEVDEVDNENLQAAGNEAEDPGQTGGTAEFAALVPSSPEASEPQVQIGATDELDQSSETLKAQEPVTEVKSATDDEHQLEENS
jgi:hypothetical protein